LIDLSGSVPGHTYAYLLIPDPHREKTAQNSKDNLPSYTPNSHRSPDVVGWRREASFDAAHL